MILLPSVMGPFFLVRTTFQMLSATMSFALPVLSPKPPVANPHFVRPVPHLVSNSSKRMTFSQVIALAAIITSLASQDVSLVIRVIVLLGMDILGALFTSIMLVVISFTTLSGN